MATVPTAACPLPTLSLKALAQEALHGTYGSGTITGPISLYDMINSGGASSGETYPAINTSANPNPVTRDGSGSLELTNVAEVMGGFSGSLYYNASIGNASNLGVGDYLYLNEALTEVFCDHYTGEFFQDGDATSTTHCGAGTDWYFELNDGYPAGSTPSKITTSNVCT